MARCWYRNRHTGTFAYIRYNVDGHYSMFNATGYVGRWLNGQFGRDWEFAQEGGPQWPQEEGYVQKS